MLRPNPRFPAFLRKALAAALILIGLSAALPANAAVPTQGGGVVDRVVDKLDGESGDLASAGGITVAADALVTPTVAEWLGPLAPVALSPFFGVTLLSGLAITMDKGLIPENRLLARAAPLKSPALFAVFLILSLLTSLPRLTKVSKPLVQALDFVETWSVVVVMLAIRAFAVRTNTDQEVAVMTAGLVSMTTSGFLMVVGTINMVVIATVRFVTEVLVWLSPVPFVDALFETGNKALCAGLMAVYAFHPMAALAINVVIFALCALLYSHALRRLRFFREVLLAPVLAKFGLDVDSEFGGSAGPTVRVFCRGSLGPFSAKEALWMTRTPDGYLLTRKRMIRPPVEHAVNVEGGEIRKGWLTHTVTIGGDELLLGRAWTPHLPSLAEAFGFTLESEREASPSAAVELS